MGRVLLFVGLSLALGCTHYVGAASLIVPSVADAPT
jgi:hypothetical protein